MTIRLIALHGFLGRASDWDGLAAELPDVDVRALDIWEVLGDAGVRDWESASAALDAAISDGCGRGRSGPAAAPAFLVAYSFGARLALGSRLLAAPGSPVRGCCLVSCNPGLADDDGGGRAARRESDGTWARRILSEPADALCRAWDAQPVFAGSAPPAGRRRLPAARGVLARVLTACSLAGQPDLRPRLRAWPTPVLWVTGSRDAKFVAIARDLQRAGVPAEFVTCEAAGHRVPWDNPAAFVAVLREWTGRSMENDR